MKYNVVHSTITEVAKILKLSTCKLSNGFKSRALFLEVQPLNTWRWLSGYLSLAGKSLAGAWALPARNSY
jgi:hypothetical protein